jgi:hypothetical protein
MSNNKTPSNRFVKVTKNRNSNNYRIVTTTNLLEPVAGHSISKKELQALINEGIKVTVITDK